MTRSDRIVFLGDSITEMGAGENGFVTLIENSLKAKHGGSAPIIINAGVGGNKVMDLQQRLDQDVISKMPTTVIVYIGINDVWHFALPGHDGTPAATYEAGLEDVIRRIQDSGAEVILCTPSVIGERSSGSNPQDMMLEEYAEISRSVARRSGVTLCDLRKRFAEFLEMNNRDNKSAGVLTVDGVHLNEMGNRLVADALIELL